LKQKMSSRERMKAAIKRECADHVPLSLYTGNWAHFGYPIIWNDQVERAECQLNMGMDPTFDIWLPLPCISRDVEIKTRRDRKGDEILITKEYHTPAGVLRQVLRETKDWCLCSHGPWIPTIWGSEKRQHFNVDLFDDYNVSRRIEPWVKDREDLDKLRYLIQPVKGHLLDEWIMDAERAMEYAKKYDILTMSRRTIVGDSFQWLCDIPWFLMQLYLDPEFVKEFLSIFQDWSRSMIELALEIGVDVVQYRGWYEIPAYWGIKFWKEFISPCIKEQSEMTHQAGKLFNYLLPEGHGIYSDLIKELTCVDVCQGVDPRMLHEGDLNYLFTKLGDSKSFWGGVTAETTLTLESENYEVIENKVYEAVDSLNRNGGLILSSFIFSSVPLKGILNLIKAWKKVCGVE
jgi:hypothetical protein